MAVNLHDALSRIQSKANVLMARYHALDTEKEKVEKLNEELKLKNLQLSKENEKLRLDNEYLRIARNISSTNAELENNRGILTQLVRDIDKCISQLKE